MACHTCGSISCCAGRDDDAPRVESCPWTMPIATWTPVHEVSRWRSFVAELVRTRRLYGYDHKRTWDAIDNLDDALEGFDSKLHEQAVESAEAIVRENHKHVDDVVRLLDEAGIAYRNVRATVNGVRITWPWGFMFTLNTLPTTVEQLRTHYAEALRIKSERL